MQYDLNVTSDKHFNLYEPQITQLNTDLHRELHILDSSYEETVLCSSEKYNNL